MSNRGTRSLSDRDKKLLYILFSVVIVAASYFFGFTKLQEKKNEMANKNMQLQSEVSELRRMDENKEAVQKDTQDKQEEIEKMLEDIPGELRTQNAIWQLNKFESKYDEHVIISAENFTMNQVYYANGALIEDTVSSQTTDKPSTDGVFVGCRSDISVSCDITYNALKRLVNYINNNDERMSLSDIAVTQKDGTRFLNCTFVVSMYSVGGTEKEFEQPNVSSIRSGKENIFVKNANR